MKFSTSPMRIKLVVNPMMIATTRAFTVTFPPVNQTKLLEATSALASVRPATTIRKNPAASVSNATPDDWTSAARTCSARAPVMLASSVTVSGSTEPDRTPIRPTPKTTAGTKKRNRRNAIALPRTDPAETRSRS